MYLVFGRTPRKSVTGTTDLTRRGSMDTPKKDYVQEQFPVEGLWDTCSCEVE